MITKLKNMSIHIKHSKSLQNVLNNIGWLVSEKVVLSILGLVVSILAARHFGPEKIGSYSYVQSIIGFLNMFVYLGLGGVIINELVKKPDEKKEIMGSVLVLKLCGAVVGYSVIIIIALMHAKSSSLIMLLLLVLGLQLFPQCLDMIDFWFQAKTKNKVNVYTRSSAHILAILAKLTIIAKSGGLLVYALVNLIEVLLTNMFRIIAFHKDGEKISEWKYSKGKSIDYLSKSWILLLSGFLSMINLRIDQVMLQWLKGSSEVGLYSVAVTLSEGWYFLPSVITLAIFPKLIFLKNSNPQLYNKRIKQLLDIMVIVSVSVAIIVYLSADWFISTIYGDLYKNTSTMLVVQIWGGVFVFMRSVFSRWIIMEDLLIFSLTSYGFGAIVNVTGNLVLIPQYGGTGASVATLISYAVSSYVSLFFFAKTRPFAMYMTQALFFPTRYLAYAFTKR
jgi:O-antigen/teichoic acid export membrane protein